jgi:hypothetical protein
MQTTILTCDWCVAAKGKGVLPVFAVGTFTLQNGKPRARAPRLDLCGRCGRELERYFRPHRKMGRPAGAVPAAEKGTRAAKWGPVWKKREDQVLGALKGEAEGLRGPELMKKAKLTKHYCYKLTARLLAAGKIKRVGADGTRQGFVLT